MMIESPVSITLARSPRFDAALRTMLDIVDCEQW
jgi:hypothetical protein